MHVSRGPFDIFDDKEDESDYEADDYTSKHVSHEDEDAIVAVVVEDCGLLDSIEQFIEDTADQLGWDAERAKKTIRRIIDESF